MALLTSYRHLEKKKQGETDFLPFLPLRAVGLSVELGWKLLRDTGILVATKLRQVEVSGQLRVLTEGSWRNTQRCSLQLAPRDAALAHKVVTKQCAMLSGLDINVWFVDVRPQGGSRTYDLLGSFSPCCKNFGVVGKLWVEIKVVSARRFEEDVEKWQKDLQLALPQERQRDPDLGGVLLLVASVEGGAGGQWAAPTHFAALKAASSEHWQVVAGAVKKASRGKCKGQKPPLQTVLDKMEWLPTGTGSKVGLLRDFLRAFGLPVNNTGQRAEAFNALLAKERFEGRLEQVKLANKTGRWPWVASRSTFHALYKHL